MSTNGAHDPESDLWKDDPQAFLFEELSNDWRREWQNMPEYSHENMEPYKSVIIHFAAECDYALFAETINQTLHPRTISTWFPPAEIGRFSNKRFIDES